MATEGCANNQTMTGGKVPFSFFEAAGRLDRNHTAGQ